MSGTALATGNTAIDKEKIKILACILLRRYIYIHTYTQTHTYMLYFSQKIKAEKVGRQLIGG